MPDKLAKFKELLLILQDSVNKEEFLKAFQAVLDYVKKIETELNLKADVKTQQALNELEKLNQIYSETISRIKEDNQSTLSNLKKWALERVGELFIRSQINKTLTDRLKEVDDRLENIRDGIDGLPGEPGAPGLDGKDGTEITPFEVRDKLEFLKGDERLEISAIKNLEEELEELRKLKTQKLGGGGGMSKLGLEMHFVDFEEPTDSGDHLNFTIGHTPSPASSFHLFRSRAEQIITEDYTLTGTALVLTVALDPTTEKLWCHYRI